MSRWKELFELHPIHETIAELKSLVNTEFDDISDNEVSERRRMIKALTAYEEALSKVDPELVPISLFESLNTSLRAQNLLDQLKNYAGHGGVTYLINANDELSTRLTPLSHLLSIIGQQSPDINVKELEETVDYVSNTLAKKKEDLELQLDKISETAENNHLSFKNLEELIEKRKTETDTLVSQWQQQFSEAQERRNAEFSAWRNKVDAEAEIATKEIITEANDFLEKQQNSYINKIDKILTDGNEKHQSIIDLYELTAGDSVGAGYLKNASDERGQANFWRWISVAFIVATALWLFYAYCNPPSNADIAALLWPRILAVFSLTGVLLFGAAFSSQQSNRHRANEKRASWFALQVKAIDPFINTLELKERNELKRLLSERLFANPDDVNESQGTVISEHALNVIVKSITDILGKVPKP